MRVSSILVFVAACGGGGTSTKDASTPADSHGLADSPVADGPQVDGALDAPSGVDAMLDAPGVDAMLDASGVDAMLDAPGSPVLKVKNYLAWCSVTVNGGAASPATEQDVTVAPGTINVSAVALPGFALGPAPWHDTAGDTGAGDPGTVTGTGQAASSATTVVVGASGKCVWVCCPFSTGGGCPTADQCP